MWLLVLGFLFFETDSWKTVHVLANDQRLKVWWDVYRYCDKSKNSMSLIIMFFTFVFAFEREVEKSVFGSSMQVYTFFRCVKSIFVKPRKEIDTPNLKKVRYIPFVLFSNQHTVMKELNKFFGGHPILVRILNKPTLLIRSNAFVSSVNEIYNSLFCSQLFFFSWWIIKILSIVDRPERNPHCYSVLSFCKLL